MHDFIPEAMEVVREWTSLLFTQYMDIKHVAMIALELQNTATTPTAAKTPFKLLLWLTAQASYPIAIIIIFKL